MSKKLLLNNDEYNSNLIAKYTSKTQGLRPTFNDGYNYTVTKEELVNGIYEVELSADTDFSHVDFNGKTDLLTVDYLKVTDKTTDTSSMFYVCTKLTNVNTSNWVTSNVTNMSYMFANCNALTSLDLSNFDTSKATSMNNMFRNCNKITLLNISNFDTKNVTSMAHMFNGCSRLTQLDVSNFDTSKVTDMTNIFYNCLSLTDLYISNWTDLEKSQTAINILPVGDDSHNIIHTNLNLTPPSGWTISSE